jgi:hypothetical protein
MSVPKVYSAEEISEIIDHWKAYVGFSGETCANCPRTANILSGGPGWLCVCGHYNSQFFGTAGSMHPKPDMGPSLGTIVEGKKLSKKYSKLIGSCRRS